MIELLQQGSRHGWERLKQAVEQALDIGCTDAAAVRHLLVFGELAHAPVERLALGGLERYERPLPVMSEYDLLLTKWRRWRDEARHRGSGTCQRKAVLQGAARCR